jgi:hypothetical protein
MAAVGAVVLLFGGVDRAAAQERHWMIVAISGETTTYLDSLGIKRVGSGWVEVWTRETYATPRQSRDGAYDSVVGRRWIDCEGARMRTMQSANYYGATLVRRYSTSAARRRWYAVRVGPGYQLMQTACRIARNPARP